MSSDKEQTIPFLPTRLNRESSVYGGLSVSEFMLAAAMGFILGAVLGLLCCFALGFDFWLLIPSLLFFNSANRPSALTGDKAIPP